jgi:hypothetical protein
MVGGDRQQRAVVEAGRLQPPDEVAEHAVGDGRLHEVTLLDARHRPRLCRFSS